MGSHKGRDIHMFTIEGLTMASGRSLNLTKGQFGVVDMESVPTSRGSAVISNFAGVGVDRKVELRLGIAPIAVTRSQSNKAYSTQAFKISDIVGLAVEAPKTKGIQTDEFRLGYDGLNPDTAIVLANGDNEVIEVNLEGKPIGLLGYSNAKAVVKLYIEAPNTGSFTNQEIIEGAVKTFNNLKLMGGVPVTNYVEATTVNSESVAMTGTDYKFFKLSLKDFGDYTALAKVQAQYPTYEVKKETYLNNTSTYVILAPAATVLDDYTETVTSTLPECAECPEGYTLTNGLCVNATTTTTVWTSGDVCKVGAETYTIVLADTKCGDNRLAELQAAYPDLTITVASATTDKSTRAITLTGTDGTANINIAGVDYLATFNIDLETTAEDFVAAHAATILAATGAVVTSLAGVITVTDLTVGFPAITSTNATLTLDATEGAVTVVSAAVAGGCMTTYTTTVTTNVVCEECSPILNDIFVSEKPEAFQMVDWVGAPKVYSATALMGINFKAKAQILAGNEQFRDDLPFIATSVRMSISGGEPTVSESFSVGRQNRMAVKLISIAQEPESMGGDLYDWEARGKSYFGSVNASRLEGNNYGKWILGEETHINPTAQYVDYVLSVRSVRFAQSFGGEVVENFNYHIMAEVGKHAGIETILNALATKAGVATVAAYS